MVPSIRHARAIALLASVRDIIDLRPAGAEVPAWCAARGWTEFLAALPDEVVHACERDGLGLHLPSLPGAPPDLADLAREVQRVTDLPVLRGPPRGDVSPYGASPRKRAQVGAFGSLAARVSAALATRDEAIATRRASRRRPRSRATRARASSRWTRAR